MQIVLATSNANKLREFRAMLKDFTIQILSLKDFPGHPFVLEDGATFALNALKKARIVARHTGLVTIADDSGLEVDHLGGMPGIFSARYAGKEASDQKNTAKILSELEGVPAPDRGACFQCVIAIVDPSGREETVAGTYRGTITTEPRGHNGFGYDPVFLDPLSGLTFAEMDPARKNQISHRAQALKGLGAILPEFLRKQTITEK